MKKFARTALIVYLLTWLGIFLFIVIVIAFNDRTLVEAIAIFIDLAPNASFLKGFHIFYLPVLGAFFLIRYLVISFQKRDLKFF